MKLSIVFSSLLLASAVFGSEETVNVYQLTLTAHQSDMQLLACIDDQCQESFEHKEFNGAYIYNFGTFPVPKIERIALHIFKRQPDERRVRRLHDYIPGSCSASNCGYFEFVRVSGPATSTTDTCGIGWGGCPRGGPPVR